MVIWPYQSEKENREYTVISQLVSDVLIGFVSKYLGRRFLLNCRQKKTLPKQCLYYKLLFKFSD